VFILEYTDGFKATTLMLDGHLRGFGYAARINGQVESTEFNSNGRLQDPFTYQGLNIQEMFLTGKPQYPVERSLLVSGVMDALMESRHRKNTRISTPHLNVKYDPFGPFITGAS
jgi:hypothetical protein